MTNDEAGNGAVVAEREVTEPLSFAAKTGFRNARRTHAAGLMLLIAGALLAALVGTWLVWFSVYMQRTMAEEEIRGACRRVMPETADRCFDTVIIQRGGARR